MLRFALRTNPKFYPMNVTTLTEQILQKMSGIGKVESRFFVNLVNQWLRLRGRYCFENMVRQGFLNAMSYRRHFSKPFDFAKFNHLLIEQSCSEERIICFDPSYISKSGKHTQGIGKFWSGCAQSLKWGLEIASLAIGDVKNHTAFHYCASQTNLKEKQSPMAFYIAFIKQYAVELRQMSNYIVVDAFFSKHDFISEITDQQLHVITRLRDDAALWYLYEGPKKQGRGRPIKYAGKVLLKEPHLQYFTLVQDTSTHRAYQAVVFSKSLKVKLKVLLVHNLKADGSIKNCKVFACTDTTLAGSKVWQYYKLRFQQEFLFRDGKQFMGLTHCQSRQKERLFFQFNFSLTILSIVKVVHWLNKAVENRPAFSVQDIKTQYFNEHLLDKFIIGLGICPETAKNSDNYRNLINYTKIAA
jgi:hypothetical protein